MPTAKHLRINIKTGHYPRNDSITGTESENLKKEFFSFIM